MKTRPRSIFPPALAQLYNDERQIVSGSIGAGARHGDQFFRRLARRKRRNGVSQLRFAEIRPQTVAAEKKKISGPHFARASELDSRRFRRAETAHQEVALRMGS